MRGRVRASLGGVALALYLATPGVAQEVVAPDGDDEVPELVTPRGPDPENFPIGTPANGAPEVLIVNLERIFAESLFGQRVRADLGAAQEALIAENDEIQAALQAEESSLATRRPTMEVDAFRTEADAFDTRVQEIRREQDAKEAELQQVLDDGRADFRAAVEPVIARLMVELGASVVLYHTSVYVAVSSADITDEAVSALDSAIGAGGQDGGGQTAPSVIPAQDAGLPLMDPGSATSP